MRDLLKALKATADESRLRILNILRIRPLCVCEIADVLGLAQSTISRHLKILEESGLLERTKDGLWVEYRLASTTNGSVPYMLLELLKNALHGLDTIRKDEQKAQQVNRNVLCAKE